MDWWEITATVLAYLGVLACVLAFLGGAARLRDGEQDEIEGKDSKDRSHGENRE